MDELNSKQEDVMIEAGRERDMEKKEKKQCGICKNWFDEEDLDMTNGIWFCRLCEDDLEQYREDKDEEK